MANAKTLRWPPNATYIPLTRVGVSRWGFALGFRVGGNANFRVGVGGNANFRVGVGGNANFSVFRYMLVQLTQNRWGLALG